jgi:hypothetical protein
MTADEFKKWALDLETRGLLKRNGERNGEIVWVLTEAGIRLGFPPVPAGTSHLGFPPIPIERTHERRRLSPTRGR